MTLDTESIDRLFLELSQFTTATTAKELALLAEVDRLAAENEGLKAALLRPLTEEQIVACLVDAGCLGTVHMSYDAGPYEITRSSLRADAFVRAIEKAREALEKP